jgi:acyl-CoA thioesterase FadM
VEINYLSPGRYGDIFQIFTQVERIGNSSIHFVQEIQKDKTILVTAKIIWVCLGKDHKAKPVPREIRHALQK